MFQIITRRRNVIVETVHPLILCASPIPDASCRFSEVSSFSSCLECFFEDSFSEDFHFMLDLTNEDICLIKLTMSFNRSACMNWRNCFVVEQHGCSHISWSGSRCKSWICESGFWICFTTNGKGCQNLQGMWNEPVLIQYKTQGLQIYFYLKRSVKFCKTFRPSHQEPPTAMWRTYVREQMHAREKWITSINLSLMVLNWCK